MSAGDCTRRYGTERKRTSNRSARIGSRPLRRAPSARSPLQLGRQDAADDYETLLSYFPNLELAPISRAILIEAAALRARHRLPTPDAIQLATAIHSGATLAITNDEAWKNVGGIDTLLLTELRRDIP